MRFAPIALLTTAAALISGPGGAASAAASSDITVETRTTFGGDTEISRSALLQVKGPRLREMRTWAGLSVPDVGSPAVITQCDARRVVLVNDKKRLYAISPLRDGGPIRATDAGWTTTDTRPVAETMTIDAVDTGERRTFGPFIARHVVTTTTTARAGQSGPVTTRVQDGWYLDVPSACGDADGVGASVLIAGSASVRVEVRWKGTAKTGWTVIETDRTVGAEGTFVSRTALVGFSQAPLNSALFDVPHGYRAALPLGHGRFDLETADTAVNRVKHAVEDVASWVHYTWSRMTSPGPTARITAQ